MEAGAVLFTKNVDKTLNVFYYAYKSCRGLCPANRRTQCIFRHTAGEGVKMFPKRIIAAGVAALSLAACSGISSEPPASVTLEAAYARVSARAEVAYFWFSFEDFAQMYLDEGYDSVQEYERCWLDALPLTDDRAASRFVKPITEQYTMQDYPWGQEKIPGGGLMEKKGCAITLAANIAVSEGVNNITPETIRSDNGNFNASGLKWDTALSCTHLGIGDKVYGQLFASTFRDLKERSSYTI
jgi:hypothetical protein